MPSRAQRLKAFFMLPALGMPEGTLIRNVNVAGPCDAATSFTIRSLDPQFNSVVQ